MRTSQVEYDSSVTAPSFGYQRAFSKPSDWIRTVDLASDEYFRCPMTHLDYADEREYWWSDLETIYVRYISDDSSYGLDYSLWPQSFIRYIEAYLASQIAPRVLQGSEQVEKIEKLAMRRLTDARSKDALNEGAKFFPAGSWVSARRGGGGRSERGSRNSLTG